MLIILGGLPGVGKSTIAKRLAETLKAVYLRIDSIEQAIRDAGAFNHQGPIAVVAEGYMTTYAIARDNLEIGLTVVADSVNPIHQTRADYRKVAQEADSPYIEVEIICSDKRAHKKRVETRTSNIKGLKSPTWQEVITRDYELWDSKAITIDTSLYTAMDAISIILCAINRNQ